MSILSDDQSSQSAVALVFLTLLATSFAVAGKLGVFAPARINGPRRWGAYEPKAMHWALFLVGIITWLAVPTVYSWWRAAQQPARTTDHTELRDSVLPSIVGIPATDPLAATLPATAPDALRDSSAAGATTRWMASAQPSTSTSNLPPTSKPAMAPSDKGVARPHSVDLSPRETAVLSSVAPLISLAVVALATIFLRKNGLRMVGFTRQAFLRGAGMGIVGIAILLIPMIAVNTITEILLDRLHWNHPMAHEMLLILGQSRSIWLTAAIIISATVIAPIWEEFLFRGQLQTALLRSICALWQGPGDEPMDGGAPVLAKQSASPAPPPPWGEAPIEIPISTWQSTSSESPDLCTGAPQPHTWQRWMAIIMTSVLFALVHDPWMFVPIFFLSLWLGYAYERTGNLWTNIFMHALFNLSMILLFIAGTSGNS